MLLLASNCLLLAAGVCDAIIFITLNKHLRLRLLENIGMGMTTHYIEGILMEATNDNFLQLNVTHEKKFSFSPTIFVEISRDTFSS